MSKDAQKEMIRGARAEHILSDQLVKQAFCDIREEMYSRIEKSSLSDQDTREESYLILKAMDVFERHFKKHIETGQLAKAALSGKVAKRLKAL